MKPTLIMQVLDMALEAAKRGEKLFNPRFVGEAGLAKSFYCQEWAKQKKKKNPNFFFFDLRIAYLEAPDVIGFPDKQRDENDILRTIHALPEFWPSDPNAEGVILFEEVSRGTNGVMNTLMQVLTDRKIHVHPIPQNIILVGVDNPETSEYSVNAMDAALKDRFVDFEITYDHNSFCEYISNKEWNSNIQNFIKSGIWIYKDTKSVGKNKYISPRTWEKMEIQEKVGASLDRQLHFIMSCATLGTDIGKEYHKFCFDDAPVTNIDLLEDKDKALDRLKKQSEPTNYRGDMIMNTVESIVKNYTTQAKDDEDKGLIGEETMAAVAKIIPADQAMNLIKACGNKYSTGSSSFFKSFIERHPELIHVLKSNLKITRAMSAPKK